METLVIVSEAGNILLMTRTWDVLSETPLFQEDFGEAKFVSVGWGSKETQFHGSEGKHARGKKEIVQFLADWDDRKARIVWRADGLFFAVNAVEQHSGNTVMKLALWLYLTIILQVTERFECSTVKAVCSRPANRSASWSKASRGNHQERVVSLRALLL